ncbi:MAG: AI-2E family transporter [Eubacteriales bacterium]|nr:AI-2E family transporter [Eubacteriales bacterium]
MKYFKDGQVIKGITIGSVLIVVYLALNNINGILGTISYFAGLIMPFIVGGVIAFILNVPMKAIEKKLNKFVDKKCKKKHPKVVRITAYMLTLIAILAVIAGVILVVVPELVSTISQLISQIPNAVNNLINWLELKLSSFPEYEEKIKNITINWDSILANAMSFLSVGTRGIINGGIGAISGLFSGITNFFIGFVFSVYVLFQKERLSAQCKKLMYVLLSESKADRIVEVMRLTNTTFSNFLSGQCLEACILGCLFVVTMLILRLPYALLIGIIIAVTALVPIVGAFMGCAVGAVLIMIDSPLKAVIFIVVFLILQQIEGNLIYPHVVGNSVGLPGIWVLVAVTIGGNLFGIMGMLTFIPISSVCYALLRTYVNRKIEEKEVGVEKYNTK